MSRAWTGRLDTDHWDRWIVDGWPVDLSAYVGKRVEIVIREIGADPESYEALARRSAGEGIEPIVVRNEAFYRAIGLVPDDDGETP